MQNGMGIGSRIPIQSSDTLLNPIPLLVRSHKEMSRHVGLATGINPAEVPPLSKLDVQVMR